MGNFYTNITLRGPTQDAVAASLRRGRRAAYVAPEHPGGITVYEERCESQDPELLGGLAGALSGEFVCPALAVLNHDDDILALGLYDRGELVSQFETGHASGFQVTALCRAWGRGSARPFVWLLLHGPRPLFEVTRHALLARSLSLPGWSVGAGFRYIAQGEYPDDLDPGRLIDTRRPSGPG